MSTNGGAVGGGGARRQAVRRYPALAYLAMAGALALVLPSGLNVLQSGPATLAEYAPVPGEGEGSSNASELGQAVSAGLGSTPGSGATGRGQVSATTLPESAARPGRLVYRPGTKRCVKHPDGRVRQTEDPVSPTCLAFFDGGNGGATAKGVTAESVTVLVRGIDDPTRQDNDTTVHCSDPPQPDDGDQVVACKAYQRYFNERYQTYAREVRLVLSREAIPEADARYEPFATVSPYTPQTDAAKRGTLAIGYQGVARRSYEQYAPYVMSFRPDQEDELGIAASYICNQLVGRPARYSGNIADRDDTRVFGFWHDDSLSKPTVLKQQLLDTCGLTFTVEAADRDDPTIPARMQAEGVTTVVIMMSCGGGCYTVPGTLAAQAGWLPEWIIPGDADSTRIDTNGGGRAAHQAAWANAFGLTYDYRRDAIGEQHWARAFREGCPDCAVPTAGATAATLAIPAMYDTLTLLFYGIQAAGPRLTAGNVDRGLHSISQDRSTDPYKPAAYFVDGNHSFVKDAAPIWWDPAGSAPGASRPGCYRLPDGGARYRRGEWPANDDLVRAAGPCQGDQLQE